MSKGAYIGIGEKARKIKKIYVGIADKARKVKKGYIGINGVAKLFFASTDAVMEYPGDISSLSKARRSLAATHVGNYAIFAGGQVLGDTTYGSYITVNDVEAYSNTLVKTTRTSLPSTSSDLAASSVGNYAIFAGGSYTDATSTKTINNVSAYNVSLVRTIPSASLTESRCYLAAATIGNYAIFAGGSSESVRYLGTADVYNSSLSKIAASDLSQGRHQHTAATVGNYAIFAGGWKSNSEKTDTVESYSNTLSRVTRSSLSSARANLSATSVGNYAIFGGGTIDNGDVDAYNTSLTRVSLSPQNYPPHYDKSTAATLGNFALFSTSSGASILEVYNSSLTKVENVYTYMRNAQKPEAAVVGNYAIFAGTSNSGSSETSKVIPFTI